MTEYDKGHNAALQIAIQCVLDYAEETRADRKREATEYLQAVAMRLIELKKR